MGEDPIGDYSPVAGDKIGTPLDGGDLFDRNVVVVDHLPDDMVWGLLLLEKKTVGIYPVF